MSGMQGGLPNLGQGLGMGLSTFAGLQGNVDVNRAVYVSILALYLHKFHQLFTQVKSLSSWTVGLEKRNPRPISL